MTKQLAVDALRAAYWRKKPKADLMHHSVVAARANSTGRRNTSIEEVFMGRPAGWMQKLTGRVAMRSLAAPLHRRKIERRFWQQIATGITSEKAAEEVGVSQAVSTR